MGLGFFFLGGGGGRSVCFQSENNSGGLQGAHQALLFCPQVGGESNDPALDNLLSHIDDENIPSRFKSQKGHIKKGTIITFKKHKHGNLKTFAEDVELGTITSAKLCAALFDLYIGEKPVCENAKLLAGKRVAHFIQEHEREPRSRKPRGLLVMGANDNAEAPCNSQGLCLIPRQFDFGGLPQFEFGH